MKILQCIQHLGSILHLIKNEQRLFGHNILPARHRKIRENAAHILRSRKELPILRILVKVKVRDILIVAPTKLPEQPRLSDLTRTLHDERLSIRALLPCDKFLHRQSLHAITSFYIIL